MEHDILCSMGKEGASNLVSLLSKSLEPVAVMHNNDRVICSCVNTMFLEDYSLFYQAKSRKYQGVFEVKSRVKTWQVRGIWSQQLEH